MQSAKFKIQNGGLKSGRVVAPVAASQTGVSIHPVHFESCILNYAVVTDTFSCITTSMRSPTLMSL
jgi:hypothetical protein